MSQLISGGMRRLVAFVILLLVAGVPRAEDLSKIMQTFDIPAQSTGDALNVFSKQSGLRLLFSYDDVVGRRTQAIKGKYSAGAVLTKLLSGTGLHYEVTADSVVVIKAAAP